MSEEKRRDDFILILYYIHRLVEIGAVEGGKYGLTPVGLEKGEALFTAGHKIDPDNIGQFYGHLQEQSSEDNTLAHTMLCETVNYINNVGLEQFLIEYKEHSDNADIA